MFVASWTGVVRYHGPRPVNRPNNVWVCNHTSMIDYIILTSYSPFAVIMQLHAGWIAFIQTRVLSCLGCLWFNRNEVSFPTLTHAIRMVEGWTGRTLACMPQCPAICGSCCSLHVALVYAFMHSPCLTLSCKTCNKMLLQTWALLYLLLSIFSPAS